jgi:ERCC4-type nuclease
VTVDTREPCPHPWAKFLPNGWELVRERLETGDLALAAIPEAAVVERKTPSDLVACMTSARDRFERELMRSRYVGRLVVVIEGGLQDVLAARRQMSEASVIGTLAAWTLRFCPFVFCGSQREAANFAFRLLAAQVRDAERVAKAISLSAVLHTCLQ